MEARRAAYEASSSGIDNQEPVSPGFVPCSSPSAGNTLVMPWSQVLNSQPMFSFMERPIPLRHPYLQMVFATQVGDWNKQSGNEPYSSLSAKDRRNNKLPVNFAEDSFDAIDLWMHRRHSVSGRGVSESGTSVNEGVQTPNEAASRSGVRSEQHGPESPEDDSPVEQPAAPVQAGHSMPPDATGVSNSGKVKKSSAKQDAVVDAISDFSSQLVDVEKKIVQLDRCLLIGVLCAVQTVIEFYEDEEDLLSVGPFKRA
ncbi:hypothetical protein R1sor_014469 [Riccia sorocarpa]|uniref:Uncharacterized protein n=1 Tax=Riccia sorocarpa TaxID=122646 RepID=A0ABD3HDB0_9MARC